MATSTKLESLSKQLDLLNQDFNNYKTKAEAEIKVLSLKLTTYKGVSIGLGVGVAGVGVWAAGHYFLKIW
jgi:hypothetical protein